MYWYEKEPQMLKAEKDGYMQFIQEYGHEDADVFFDINADHKFVATVNLPYQMDKNEPWRHFQFQVVYEHDHPRRGSDGMFGGSITVTPFTKTKDGFHHLLNANSAPGLKKICQVRSTSSAEINSYIVMQRVLRFLIVYCVWEKTGVDVDK